jgi:glutathione synthase
MSDHPRIGFVMDPISGINPAKDSTLALMLAAQEAGCRISVMDQHNLWCAGDQARARWREISVYDDQQHWYVPGAQDNGPVTAFDILMMRSDPPVDKRFIHTTYTLETAAAQGVHVVNRPAALRDYNEKRFACSFPDLIPPTLITADYEVLQDFRSQHDKLVLKPLDAMGGQGVFVLDDDDPNFDVVWEMHTNKGAYPLMAQAFLPGIAEGDKRVLVIDGRPFDHALVRTPKTGSLRGNLAAGGSYDARPLNGQERAIAEQVGPVLKRKGITLAGLDIIGDKLIEINITSPTGLRELYKLTGDDPARHVIAALMA